MAPAKLPGCSGSRNLNDNISDLQAQVAANQKASVTNTVQIMQHAVYTTDILYVICPQVGYVDCDLGVCVCE